jgi:hypothetical protein
MLDFNFESPTRVSLVEVNKAPRAVADRRAANSTNAANQPAMTMPHKRRRHDGLYSGKPVPLQW